MENAEELFELIHKYEEYIKKANNLFKTVFKIKKSPLLARYSKEILRTGTLSSGAEEITYSFHGIGCYLEFDGIIVDFDYTSIDFLYEGIQVFKFFMFVESYPNSSKKIKDKKVFDKALWYLEYTGRIIRSEPTSYKYDFRLAGDNPRPAQASGSAFSE